MVTASPSSIGHQEAYKASVTVFLKSPCRQTTASSHAASPGAPSGPKSAGNPAGKKKEALGKSRSLLSSQSETHIKAHEARKSFQRPKFWVLFLGWFLASCAGFVNTCAFLTWGMFASHMTGASSSIGLHLEGYHHKESTLLLRDTLGIVLYTYLGTLLP